MGKFIDKWLSRFANGLALYPFVPAGLLAVIAGYLSTGVSWISQFGAFGWFAAGFATFLLSSLAFAAFARARLWRIDAWHRARLLSDSSPFDPMASVYQDKRLFLRDLAPAGRNFVVGKTFINCEIIGPGTAKLATRSGEHKPWPVLSNNLMHYTDIVESDPEAKPENAVFFPDCSFQGCHFFSLTLLFDVREDGIGWNWITRDYRQPILTDQTAGATDG